MTIQKHWLTFDPTQDEPAKGAKLGVPQDTTESSQDISRPQSGLETT